MTWEISYVCISGSWALVAAWGIFCLWTGARFAHSDDVSTAWNRGHAAGLVTAEKNAKD